MTIIRPAIDLRENFTEISELCHSRNEPVYITRQGKEDMVVMSHAHYEMLIGQLKLYGKLSEAEVLDEAGETGITHPVMMQRLKKRLK